MTTKPLPRRPKHPERVCWGCDKLCAASSLACGNGTERTQHPAELFGDDWDEWNDGDGSDGVDDGAVESDGPVENDDPVPGEAEPGD